jgi:outer membrane protein TolC
MMNQRIDPIIIGANKRGRGFSRACVCFVFFALVRLALEAFAQNNAPPSPSQPWLPPGFDEYEKELASMGRDGTREKMRVGINPDKVYELPELIDIAERSQPEARSAWERARQAATAVGLTESAYYPYLVASAAAGYERAFLPFPTLRVSPGLTDVSITGGGTETVDSAAEGAALNLKWLLFDFGGRKATTAAAMEKLMMANVGFNAVHQKIVFEVTQRFYEFDAVREKVAAAESSMRAADIVAKAAQARVDHGLATKPELLEAEQQTAQASFELEAARGALSDGQVALVESLGILPTTQLQVAKASAEPLPENIDGSLDTLIDRALSQRPDLVARLANVRASRADVQQARAAYYPKIALGANAGFSELDVSINNSSYFGGSKPVYGVGVSVELPIFDGFARSKKLRIAQSELEEAESELSGSRDAVVREVWKAYTDFRTELHKEESATRLLSAAQSAFDASLQAYQQGLGTYVDVVNAQRNLDGARSVMVDTRSAIFTGATALALSIGDLAKPKPTAATVHSK